MVNIIHISDTHLGFRLRYDYKKGWFKFGEIKWYENEFYQRWNGFLKYCIENQDDIDFIVHSGDLFDLPHFGRANPSPEPARESVVKGLRYFFKNTENKIPFILIDGNHGIYQGYRYSPMDSITPIFPELYYFSVWDLKKAIDDNKPLKCEFPEKNTRFYLFPYFEYKLTKEIQIAYNSWIENQRPKEDMVEIAVAHASDIDETLHEKIKTFNYSYIALGHEHNQKKLKQNMYYSGSFVPLNFNEIGYTHGYLKVKIQENQNLYVKEHYFESLRDFEIIEIEITPSLTSQSIIEMLKEAVNPYKTEIWDGNSAARLKIKFIGTIPLQSFWGLLDEINNFKSRILNEGRYNILQLVLNWTLLTKDIGDELKPEIIKEYILNNPKEEFLQYIKGKMKTTEGFDMNLLAEIAVNTIENALKKYEGSN